MNTLIVYATKHGCTEKCAKILAEKLTGNVELRNVKDAKVLDLTPYDKVIIGGSIYVGKIQGEINAFCEKNDDVLQKKKIGLFICNMLQGEKAKTELDTAFPQVLLAAAVAKTSFGGAFSFKKMNPMEKVMVKMVSKVDQSAPTIVNTKNDISNILEDNITRFAQLMNMA